MTDTDDAVLCFALMISGAQTQEEIADVCDLIGLPVPTQQVTPTSMPTAPPAVTMIQC